MHDEYLLQKTRGRVINGGCVSGDIVVSEMPFSFVGDFDPETGIVTNPDNNLYQQNIANKILVCPTGRGGTLTPIVAYIAQKNGTLPSAILCKEAEPLIVEAAIVSEIPIIDSFPEDPFKLFSSVKSVQITEKGEIIFNPYQQ